MITTGKIVTKSAAPQSDKKFDPSVLFGPDSTETISHVFEVTDAHNYIFVEAFGLDANDVIHVDRVAGEGSGKYFNRIALKFTRHTPSWCFSYIGRYRLVYEGSTPLGAFFVHKLESWKNDR